MTYSSNKNENHLCTYSNAHNPDALKLIESLRARLTFAQFKLNNGWEKSSIVDIESFWKKKQKKLMSEIPTPRFTQQDIIDKRFHPIKKRLKSINYPHNIPKTKGLNQTTSDLSSLIFTSLKECLSNDICTKPSFCPSLESQDKQNKPSNIKNSLDCLSYAIAITKQNQSSSSEASLSP